MGEDWKSDPMSEKQKAMLILYGVIFKEGLTKGEASQLIENAINSGAKPTVETQAKAGEIWGNYRMTKIVEEMAKAIDVISNESVTIKTLKETKKKVKESVSDFTELIDRRIETLQDVNREIRYEKTSDWLKEHGF
jgi:gas vesicle protein